MSNYFEYVGSSSKIIINDTKVIYKLANTSSLANWTLGGQSTLSWGTLYEYKAAITDTKEIVLFCPKTKGNYAFATVVYNQMRYVYIFAHSYFTPNDMQVYTYKDNATSNDKYGLEILDANGKQIYHSSVKPLDIKQAIYNNTGEPINIGLDKCIGVVGAKCETSTTTYETSGGGGGASGLAGLYGFILNTTYYPCLYDADGSIKFKSYYFENTKNDMDGVRMPAYYVFKNWINSKEARLRCQSLLGRCAYHSSLIIAKK